MESQLKNCGTSLNSFCVFGSDPNLLQRPAGNGIEAQRLVAGEQVARLLPRDDLFHRNWLQQPGVPECLIAIGIGFVGVIALVPTRQPLGDHRREPGHFAGRLVPGPPLEFAQKAVLHRYAKADRAELKICRRRILALRQVLPGLALVGGGAPDYRQPGQPADAEGSSGAEPRPQDIASVNRQSVLCHRSSPSLWPFPLHLTVRQRLITSSAADKRRSLSSSPRGSRHAVVLPRRGSSFRAARP